MLHLDRSSKTIQPISADGGLILSILYINISLIRNIFSQVISIHFECKMFFSKRCTVRLLRINGYSLTNLIHKDKDKVIFSVEMILSNDCINLLSLEKFKSASESVVCNAYSRISPCASVSPSELFV